MNKGKKDIAEIERSFVEEIINTYHLNTQKFSPDFNSIDIREGHVIKLCIEKTEDSKFIDLLNYFPELEELYLYQDRLTEIPPFKNKKKLQVLCIGGNQIQCIDRLEDLPQLRRLELGRNNIKIIDKLGVLKQLEILNLSWNQIAKIQNLGSLQNLRILNLMNNDISEIGELDALTNLQELNLQGNRIKIIQNLTSQKKLTALNLAYNQIERIENIGHLIQLEELNLQYNPLTPEFRDYELQTPQYWVNFCQIAVHDFHWPILSFIGYSDSGKTASIEALIEYLQKIKEDCIVLKNIHKEGVELDHKDKNTWRFSQAGASIVIGQTVDKSAIFVNHPISGSDLIHFSVKLFQDQFSESGSESPQPPLILLEGYRDLGMIQILCVKSFSDIAEQFNPKVKIITGQICTNKDEMIQAQRTYQVPIINCVTNPQEFLQELKNFLPKRFSDS